jgi:hypothetical protein
MRLRQAFRGIRLAAAALGLGAGLAVLAGGCMVNQDTGLSLAPSEGSRASAKPQLPSLDLEAPAEFQTAAFAFG